MENKENTEMLREMQDCPACREGVGSLEHEGGWCCYVACLDCGAQTAHFSYSNEEERLEAERMAVSTWNQGKVIRMEPGE